MDGFFRNDENPFLTPDPKETWRAQAAFNPCVVKEAPEQFHLLFRAISSPQHCHGATMPISSIGHAVSKDGFHFTDIHLFIKPTEEWEKFGCEDPRVTFLDGKYYIFYTALSLFPFSAQGIRIGLAITQDFKKIEKKCPVTTFNSKAMALFPEKIGGKITAILTAHTDMPPAKIAIAQFDHEEEIGMAHYWDTWYTSLDMHVIPLLRRAQDHLEIGAPPLKTEQGWLVIYSYIQNYLSAQKTFGIEAVLLDLKDPKKIIGKTSQPFLTPQKTYELQGDVPNVIFPSGALIQNDTLYIYYGAADTTCCLAAGSVKDLLAELLRKPDDAFISSASIPHAFKRYQNNPILAPRPEFSWEAKSVFNPSVFFEENVFHLVYRAMSFGGNSVFGYAVSHDGIHITERLARPIYMPRETFEEKMYPGEVSGCEDPRITQLDNKFYMFYTAYDGHCPRVAFTSIKVADFLERRWHWERAKVITPPMIPCKNACLLSKKINEKFVIFFRENDSIYLNFVNDLLFKDEPWLKMDKPLIDHRHHKIKIFKLGICGPPIETEQGWILFYHWVRDPDFVYQIGVCLLALNDPSQVLVQSHDVLLQPEMPYEIFGDTKNVVFSCGAVLRNKEIFFYYGSADKVVSLAKISLDEVFKILDHRRV